MTPPDSYKTLVARGKGVLSEKGSRFISYSFPIDSEEDWLDCMREVKKEHPSAGHFCYAFSVGMRGELFRYSDDGEPSNSAGAPIFGQIQATEITCAGIVVVRYFGGTKLGVGGLIRAYRAAAKEAIDSAGITTKTPRAMLEVLHPYDQTSSIHRILAQCEGKIIEQDFGALCKISCTVPLAEQEAMLARLPLIEGTTVNFKNFV